MRDALSARAQHLLKLVIEHYIDDGRPVGSKMLAENCQLDVSSATIRNVLSDLEKMGLLASPHTSSGRIPTPEGYRFFVNQLLTSHPLEPYILNRFEKEFDPDQDLQTLLNNTSSLLSSLTRLAGVVTLPKPKSQVLTHIEFVPLQDDKLLVILVLNGNNVQNRIIHPKKKFTHSGLQKIGNYLTEMHAGFELPEIRRRLLNDLKDRRQAFDDEAETLMGAMDQILEKSDHSAKPYQIVGEANLLPIAEESGMFQLQQLFKSFSETQELLGLFDSCLDAEGVQIFIGDSSEFKSLEGCSLVTAPYRIDGKPVGVLGVIGPIRMHYEKVVPLVDITAKLLSSALN